MSADNWKKCPKCNVKTGINIEEFKKKVSGSYGIVSVEKYKEDEKKLNDMIKNYTDEENYDTHTLREDYEIYSEDFMLYVNYGCSCKKCDFSYQYNQEIKII